MIFMDVPLQNDDVHWFVLIMMFIDVLFRMMIFIVFNDDFHRFPIKNDDFHRLFYKKTMIFMDFPLQNDDVHWFLLWWVS